MAQIGLHGCAGWPATLLFEYNLMRVYFETVPITYDTALGVLAHIANQTLMTRPMNVKNEWENVALIKQFF